MIFYLGTHRPNWLGRLDVPLFVSRRWMARRVKLQPARARWALDSGGFTELSLHGKWTVPEARYAAEIRRYQNEIGSLDWAAPQDWMCEPQVIERTGLTVRDHQRLTIESVLNLWGLGAPVIPVVQGWFLEDYEQHVEDYANVGIYLARYPVVGVGTVCRRESTAEAEQIVTMLANKGIRIHAFGVKTSGLARYGHRLASADSMAWSYAARRRKLRMPQCTHQNCANCEHWALEWRQKLCV